MVDFGNASGRPAVNKLTKTSEFVKLVSTDEKTFLLNKDVAS